MSAKTRSFTERSSAVAMDRLAPHTGKDTSLCAVLHRLYCAALQCPGEYCSAQWPGRAVLIIVSAPPLAFDERRPALAEKWAFLTAQGTLLGPDPQSSFS